MKKTLLGYFLTLRYSQFCESFCVKKGFPCSCFSSILDTIETTVVLFEKLTRLIYQFKAIMLGYILMSNGKILGENITVRVLGLPSSPNGFLTK